MREINGFRDGGTRRDNPDIDLFLTGKAKASDYAGSEVDQRAIRPRDVCIGIEHEWIIGEEEAKASKSQDCLDTSRFATVESHLSTGIHEVIHMARPYWSGRIQISLVSFGVQLFVATETKNQISFHQISRSTGERVRHQKVLQSSLDNPDEGVGSAVEKQEIVKSYEYEKGRYIIVEPDELTNLRVPSKHTIDVSQFVDRQDLDPEFVEKPYFVIPENDAQGEAFAVVRKALQKTGKVAIGKVSFAGREHVVAIVPAGDDTQRGMMAYTLRYASELRNQRDYFRDIKEVEVNEDSLDLAESLIAKRSSKLDITKFEDGYEVALKELIDAKINHLPVPKDEATQAKRGNVVNLMDALRKSIGSDRSDGEKVAKKPVASAKADSKKGIGLVKTSPKTSPRRKSA